MFHHFVVRTEEDASSRRTDDLDNLQNEMRTVEPRRHSAEARSKIFYFIRDRFLRDDTYREPQLAIGWSKETCMKMDKLAQEDHSYVALRRERERYESMLAFSQRSSGSQTSATHDRGDYPVVIAEFRSAKKRSCIQLGEIPPIYSFHNAAAAKPALATTKFGPTGLGETRSEQ